MIHQPLTYRFVFTPRRHYSGLLSGIQNIEQAESYSQCLKNNATRSFLKETRNSYLYKTAVEDCGSISFNSYLLNINNFVREFRKKDEIFDRHVLVKRIYPVITEGVGEIIYLPGGKSTGMSLVFRFLERMSLEKNKEKPLLATSSEYEDLLKDGKLLEALFQRLKETNPERFVEITNHLLSSLRLGNFDDLAVLQ
jgi:hypothetical protein